MSGDAGVRGSVAIVDVYPPAVRLADAFADAGYRVVRIRSTPDVPPAYSSGSRSAPTGVDVVHRGDLDATVAAVAGHRPLAVLTGAEPGVELADLLSERLGLPTNGSALSAARRNKYVQNETLRAAGVRATRQVLVTCEEELRAFSAALGARVVVKPVRSAGNDGVRFCNSADEAVDAYRAVRAAATVFGNRGEGVVAQEYLHGVEHVVNTVSCQGRHRTTDVWRYVKMAANGVDRVSAAVSVPPGGPERGPLEDYAREVLDALGVQYGPAHLEIMLTPDGPCLVEVGVRLCGADTASYALLAGGESQIERTIQAYTDPAGFLATADAPQRCVRHVAMAFLTSPVQGVLRSYPLLPQVEALDSFHEVALAVLPGQRLPLTVDDSTEPALIGLAHPRADVLARDLVSVAYLDGHGFYDVEVGR